MIVDIIKQIFIEKKLEEKSISLFWNYLDNYRKDNPDESESMIYFTDFNKKNFNLVISTVGFRITNWPEDGYNHIVITQDVKYKNKLMGEYTILFSLDGVVEDDYFLFF